MAVTLTVNGIGYSFPQTGDETWGDNVTNWASAVTSGMLQKAGGSFVLTAEIDFGGSYGIKSLYYKTRATNPASAGQVRLGNTESVAWRNAANNADLVLNVDATNKLIFNSNELLDTSMSMMTGLITNTQVSASAAIAYSKLNLANSIVNADVAAGAAIAHSKMASLTASRAMVSDGSGVASASSVTATELGYVSGVTSAIQTQLNGKEASFVTLPISKGGTNSGTSLNNNRVMQSSGGAIVEAAAITASRALASDSNGIPVHSTVTTTELQRLSGVASAVSGNSDAATLSNKTFSDPVTLAEIATPSTPASGYGKIYFKNDGKLYQLNDDGTETQVGSGSGGGTNYLSGNPDAESSTTGWSTYADAAGTTPVDGTGGSPSSTWTRSTSSPLYGTASFLWTKSANNRQGEGVSYAFTIDAANQGKVLQIDFDYALTSGTWSGSVTPGTNSDMVVYIYDVTNGVLIEPVGKLLEPMTTGQFYRYRGTFQTSSNSTSYRFIIHTATTSASAYTLKFDAFKVGPQVISNGAAATDWTSFTPTGGWTTNTTYTGQYRRVGDTLEAQVKITLAGAPNSANLTINLPSGLSIDSAKLASTQTGDSSVGQGFANDAGSAAYFVNVAYNTSSTVILYSQLSSGTYVNETGSTAVNATTPVTWGNTDSISVAFSVPISGWSSNVQMSNDADTRVVAAYAYKNGSQVLSAAATTVTTWTISQDTHGAMSTTGTYTVPVTGWYEFGGRYTISSSSGTYGNLVNINGGGLDFIGNYVTSDRVASTSMRFMTAGQTLVPGIYSSASAGTVSSGACDWWVKRVSGPSQIAASETVACEYQVTSSGATYSSASPHRINFGTKVSDTHNAVTTGVGAWAFVAPISGRYLVTVGNYSNPSSNTNTASGLRIQYTSGSADVGYGYNVDLNTQLRTGSHIVRVLAGQSIYVEALTNDGSNNTIQAGASSSIRICRIGNY